MPRNEPAPIVEKQKGSNKLPPMLPQHQHTPAAPARPPPPQNISPSVPEDPSPAVSTAAPSNGPSLKNLLANTVPKRDDSDSETEEHQDWDGNKIFISFQMNLTYGYCNFCVQF